MFDRLKDILDKIRKMNVTIDQYKKDTIIQSLPSLAYVNRAKKLIDSKQYQEAECILNSALNLPHEDALVYKYLGIIAEKTSRKDDAIIAYKKAAKINPNDKDIWRLLGFVLVSVNLAGEAADAFENANKINPMNSDIFTGWGMSLLKQKKYNDAHEKFTQASTIDKYNFMAMLLSAIVEIKLERYDDAETKLKFLSSVSPNESNTYEYAHLKYLRNDYNSALHYAKKALTFNDKMLPAYVLIGEIYYKLKDEKNSLAAYDMAYEKELINESLYLEWGTALHVFEKYDEAREKFEKVLAAQPERVEALEGLALCYAYTGQTEAAEGILNGLSEEEQKKDTSVKAKAFIAFRNENFAQAVELFKEVLKNNEYDSRLVYYIAKSYESLQNDILTKEYYEKSINENPDHMLSYIDYTNWLIKQNDYTECQRKLRRALKNDGSNLDVLNLLFYVSYILVKDNVCEYNVKETLNIADKIIAINGESFKYWKEKDELTEILNKK